MLSQLYIFAGLLCISVLGQKQSCNSSFILSSDYTFGNNFAAYPFQPQNNQFCYFEIRVPNGTYAYLQIVGTMTSNDNYNIADSGQSYAFGEQLKNNASRTYYLPAGINKLYLNTPNPSFNNSTFGMAVKFLQINLTNINTADTVEINNAFLLYDTSVTFIRKVKSYYNSSVVISTVSNSGDPFAGTTHLVYCGADVMTGRSLGSLFFYYAQNMMFNSKNCSQISIFRVSPIYTDTSLIANVVENVQRFNGKYSVIATESLTNLVQNIVLNATNGPAAISFFSRQTSSTSPEILTNALFSSSNTRLIIEAAGPTPNYAFELDRYSSSTIQSKMPQLVNGVLRTYTAVNGTVNLLLDYRRNGDAYNSFFSPSVGKSGFLTSTTYPYQNQFDWETYVFKYKSQSSNSTLPRFKFGVYYQKTQFVSKNDYLRYQIDDRYKDGVTFVDGVYFYNSSLTLPGTAPIANGSGENFTITYNSARGLRSMFSIKFKFDQPDPQKSDPSKFSFKYGSPVIALLISVIGGIVMH